jgi:hypothetical protein
VGINDHRILAHGLGQHGDAFEFIVISGFEREPFARKGVLFFGPEQCAQKKQDKTNT